MKEIEHNDDTPAPSTQHNDSRRNFLRRSVSAAGALAATTIMPASIRKALAIPANYGSGTIEDIKHVVILMQENRSFDHYFGTLKGVRGFGDRFPITLPNGQTVWQQASTAPGASPATVIPPFHLNATTMNAMGVNDCPHDYPSGQAAWSQGQFGHWPHWKSQYSMGYYERADIPFHFALAEAFTLCDAYHCQLTGPTDPNRIAFFSVNFNPQLASTGVNSTDANAEATNVRCSVGARSRPRPRRTSTTTTVRRSRGRRCRNCCSRPASRGRSIRTRTTTGAGYCTAASRSRASAPRSRARPSTTTG